MKKLNYLSIAFLVVLLSSCGKDDGPTITHEMGTWELEGYIIENVPEGFKDKNEGADVEIDGVSFGGVIVTSYEFTLSSNKTYNRTIETSESDIVDNGTWMLEGDDLTLTEEDSGDDQKFEIVTNADDELSWSLPLQFFLLHDTVTSEYYNSLDEEGQNGLFTAVTVDLVYAFERK